MPSYTLKYFNGRGRGEPIRMLFAIKGQAFEDYRFPDGEWAKVKGNKDEFPLGQAPVLIIDGKATPQSRAIMQILARDFGLYGANNAEAGQIDVIFDTTDDVRSKIMTILFEKDEAKKTEGITKLKDTSRPYLTYLNEQIKAAGGRFFVGSSETLADVMVYTTLTNLVNVLGEEFMKENYPDLMKFREGITSNSKLTEYLKNRIPTPF